MDFIVKLLKSQDPATKIIYDLILVIVDTLTKYLHFILCKELMLAIELAYLVLDRLIRHYGIPESFITDRDKLFTSNFWKSLIGQIRIKHKLLTAFYLETNS